MILLFIRKPLGLSFTALIAGIKLLRVHTHERTERLFVIAVFFFVYLFILSSRIRNHAAALLNRQHIKVVRVFCSSLDLSIDRTPFLRRLLTSSSSEGVFDTPVARSIYFYFVRMYLHLHLYFPCIASHAAKWASNKPTRVRPKWKVYTYCMRILWKRKRRRIFYLL